MSYNKGWDNITSRNPNMSPEDKRAANIKGGKVSSRAGRSRRGDITEAALDVLGAYAPDKLLNSFQQFLTTPRLRNHATLAHVLVLSTLVKALQGDARARDTMFKVGAPSYQPAPVLEVASPEKEEDDNKMLPLYEAIDRSAVRCWGASEDEQENEEVEKSAESIDSEDEESEE